MDNNYELWSYVYSIKPNAKKEDVDILTWVTKDDVLIIFTDGKKYLYDTLTGMIRYIKYNTPYLTNEDWNLEFKRRLLVMLDRIHMSQGELALRIGTTQQMVSRYISGKDMPSAYIITKIIDVIKCEENDLFLIPNILKTYLIKEDFNNV